MKGYFFKCVSEMRIAQRQYFRTRSSEWLSKAKELERQVDEIIARENDPQGDLFAQVQKGAKDVE